MPLEKGMTVREAFEKLKVLVETEADSILVSSCEFGDYPIKEGFTPGILYRTGKTQDYDTGLSFEPDGLPKPRRTHGQQQRAVLI